MDFEQALQVLTELKAKSELFVSLTPPFYTAFDIDQMVLAATLERYGYQEDEFKREAAQVGMALFAVLSKETESYLANAAALQNDDEAGLAEVRSRHESMLAAVRESLADDRLQQRYDLKKSSKAPGFTSVDWDVKIKHFDANQDWFVPLPYATIRVVFQKDFGESPMLFFSGRAMDSVQMNFTADEIEYLQRVLTQIQRKLEDLDEVINR